MTAEHEPLGPAPIEPRERARAGLRACERRCDRHIGTETCRHTRTGMHETRIGPLEAREARSGFARAERVSGHLHK